MRRFLSPVSRDLSISCLLLVLGLAGCGQSAGGDAAADGAPPVVHVHGLGVDPSDGSVYAATHTGLVRLGDDGTAERVGERYPDLMGFTIAGPDDFIASGHPDMRDDRLMRDDAPPLLGLVVSEDKGQEWTPASLLGEVDFHTLQAAHGQVFGWDSTSGQFMVSGDRTTWETRSQLPLIDFAVSPEHPDVIVGAGEEGVLRSDDGGRTWEPVAPDLFAALTWGDSGLVGATPHGQVFTADASASTWEPQGTLGGPPEALQAVGQTLYAWVTDRGLLQSDDRGATWTVRFSGSTTAG